MELIGVVSIGGGSLMEPPVDLMTDMTLRSTAAPLLQTPTVSVLKDSYFGSSVLHVCQ